MADWNNNNRACKTTWSTLVVLDQKKQAFPKYGTIKIRGLKAYNPTARPKLRRETMAGLAAQIDNVFRAIRGATLEKGKTSSSAQNAMVKVLTDPKRTVADLAAVADAQYHFLGEPTDEAIVNTV